MNKHLVHPTETIFHGIFAEIANLAWNTGYQIMVTKGNLGEPIVSVTLRNESDFGTMPVIVVQARKCDNVWMLDSTMIFPELHSDLFEDRELAGFVASWKSAAKLADEFNKIYIDLDEQ